VIELETQPCGVVVIEKTIIVGCMDNVIHAFALKVKNCRSLRSASQLAVFASQHTQGKKQYSIYLPDPIASMCLLELKRQECQGSICMFSCSSTCPCLRMSPGADCCDSHRRSSAVQQKALGCNSSHAHFCVLRHFLAVQVKNQDIPTAMRFGPYGREEATLVLAFKSG